MHKNDVHKLYITMILRVQSLSPKNAWFKNEWAL